MTDEETLGTPDPNLERTASADELSPERNGTPFEAPAVTTTDPLVEVTNLEVKVEGEVQAPQETVTGSTPPKTWDQIARGEA
jgi:hypothetical protein